MSTNDFFPTIIKSFFKTHPENEWYTEVYALVKVANSNLPLPLPENELKILFEIEAEKEKRKIANSSVPKAQETPARNKIGFITTQKEIKDKNGYKQIINVVIPCQENVLVALRITDGIRGKFRYNIWLERRETLLECNEWRAVRDNDYNLVKSILANTYEHMALITAAPTVVAAALVQYCEENSVDPAREYLESLKWDGTSRLASWISTVYHTESNDEEYSIFGTQWLKGMVKRVIHPGCKFDNVLVLEGEQGTKKSTSLRVLGGDWHIELTTSPNDKDFFMLMKGHMIVEFSEGEIQERASMRHLKSVITKQIDTYRAP